VIEHIGSLEEQYEISPKRYYELHYRQDEEVHVILDVRPALQFDLVHLNLPGLVYIPDSSSISSVKGSDLKSRRYLLNISCSLFLALRRLSYEDICAATVVTNLLQVLSDIKASCAVGVKVFLMCRRGVDSKIVTRFLIDQARLPYQVYNLTGGCVAWHNEVDAKFPLY
jgi:rhodanese-related sulfurtransferase